MRDKTFTTETVVVPVDPKSLREPNAGEKQLGIVQVYEFRAGDAESGEWDAVRAELELAYATEGRVRALVPIGKRRREWHLLPTVGQVVDFNDDGWSCKVVFFPLH